MSASRNNPIVVQNLEMLAREEASRSLTVLSAKRSPNNELIEERRVTYFKVRDLEQGFAFLYSQYIVPARRDPEHADRAGRQLDEIIDEFDAALIAVGRLSPTHRKVTEHLEELKLAVRGKPKLRPFARLIGDTREHAELRRRSLIRKRAERVMKGLQKMKDQAETPAWLRRAYNRMWGQFDSVFDLEPDERERIRLLAGAVVAETSRKVGVRLLEPKVAEAFQVLSLPVWANRQEIHERYTFLIKQHHPDRPGGSKEKAAELNTARDTLEAYLATPASGQES